MFYDLLSIAFPALSAKPQAPKVDFEAAVREQQKSLSGQCQKPVVYDDIGHMAFGSDKYRGTMLSITEQINNHVRHARIGRITLKAAA